MEPSKTEAVIHPLGEGDFTLNFTDEGCAGGQAVDLQRGAAKGLPYIFGFVSRGGQRIARAPCGCAAAVAAATPSRVS